MVTIQNGMLHQLCKNYLFKFIEKNISNIFTGKEVIEIEVFCSDLEDDLSVGKLSINMMEKLSN